MSNFHWSVWMVGMILNGIWAFIGDPPVALFNAFVAGWCLGIMFYGYS
jgi:hypothetical protein